MKKIEASIRNFELEAVKTALMKAGVTTMKITEVLNVGSETRTITYRGATRQIDAIPGVNIETIVSDRHTKMVVDTILGAARTQSEADGFVIVSDVASVTRIRTGETETTDEEFLGIQQQQEPAAVGASRWDIPSYQHSW
jgi:nitrogen regulatory protein PII